MSIAQHAPEDAGGQAGELQRWQARARQLAVELERAAALNNDIYEAAEYNIQCLTEQLASLRASTSWRMTRPLRLARAGGREPADALSLRPLTRPPPVASHANHPDAALIRASGLFDEASYQGLAEARDMGLSPAAHYLMFGEAVGLSPSSAFDPSYYASRYSDLHGKRAGSLAHYCRIGRLEGRRCRPVAASLAFSSSAIDPRRDTILLAVDQAANAGLPASTIRTLKERYNLVVLRQEGGTGFGADASDEVVLPSGFTAEADAVARAIAGYHAPCYAIITCRAMQAFVRPLELAGIPTVSVIGHLAADTEPPGTLDSLFQAASMVVFTSQAVAASMLARYPYLAVRCFTILDDGDRVAALDRLGREARERMAIAGRDAELIRHSGSFGLDSFLDDTVCPPEPAAALWDYLHRSALAIPRNRPGTGAFVRRPAAGFHPLIYAEDNASYDEASGVDPFAHYLQAGTPAGRWQHGVIRLGSAGREPKPEMRILVHGHFHYPELLPEFLARLGRNVAPFDLVLTTTSNQHKTALETILAAHGDHQARVLAHPNRGRDIGPLLTAIGQDGVRDYDLVGHLHGKRSPQAGAAGERWRDRLWTNLAGGRDQSLDIIAAAFSRDAALGLVFPADATLNDWDRNRDIADQLAARLGMPLPLPTHLDFPQGSMFWARPQALQPLFGLGLEWHDYPAEPLPIDGTLLHALERLIPLAVTHAGYRYATTVASP